MKVETVKTILERSYSKRIQDYALSFLEKFKAVVGELDEVEMSIENDIGGMIYLNFFVKNQCNWFFILSSQDEPKIEGQVPLSKWEDMESFTDKQQEMILFFVKVYKRVEKVDQVVISCAEFAGEKGLLINQEKGSSFYFGSV